MLKILKGKLHVVHKPVWFVCVCVPPHLMYHIEDMFVSLCSYVVGSPGQRVPELDKDKPVTLEYQDSVEQQMTEVK